MGLIDIRDAERHGNCQAGWHTYDPVSGDCLWCEEQEPAFEVAHAALRLIEPPVGTIVISDGPTGNAWQRHYVDGTWRSTRGSIADWRMLMDLDRKPSRLRIVYVPPPRDGRSLAARRRAPARAGV